MELHALGILDPFLSVVVAEKLHRLFTLGTFVPLGGSLLCEHAYFNMIIFFDTLFSGVVNL